MNCAFSDLVMRTNFYTDLQLIAFTLLQINRICNFIARQV